MQQYHLAPTFNRLTDTTDTGTQRAYTRGKNDTVTALNDGGGEVYTALYVG